MCSALLPKNLFVVVLIYCKVASFEIITASQIQWKFTFYMCPCFGQSVFGIVEVVNNLPLSEHNPSASFAIQCLAALQCQVSRNMAPPTQRFRAKRSLLPEDQRKLPESSGLMTANKHELNAFLSLLNSQEVAAFLQRDRCCVAIDNYTVGLLRSGIPDLVRIRT